jgi:hypothetical protein
LTVGVDREIFCPSVKRRFGVPRSEAFAESNRDSLLSIHSASPWEAVKP